MLAHAHSLSEEHAFPEGVAWALNQRGVVSRLRGDHDRARRQQEAAILEHRRLGDRWREASGLDELALLAVLSGNLDTAALHLGHADHLRTQIGAPTPPVEREVREHVLEALAGGSSPVG